MHSLLNRRAFLALMAGAVADPERLLFRPGRKLISIPKLIPYPSFSVEGLQNAISCLKITGPIILTPDRMIVPSRFATSAKLLLEPLTLELTIYEHLQLGNYSC